MAPTNSPKPPTPIAPEATAMLHEEASTLRTVLTSLEQQRGADLKKFKSESIRARELTSELVASRRDDEKWLLASDEAVAHALKDKKQGDLTTLAKIIDRPYFARIKLEEEVEKGTKELEYKIGFSANPDCRIIDWRTAPLSKLYYEYKEGDDYSETILGRERSGRVTLRNTVEIERRLLKKVTCRHGTFSAEDAAGTQWKQIGGAASATSGHIAGNLPQILALITPEQFRLITEDAKTAILIQGIAGSGKTTVALHRLAWMLHPDNARSDSGALDPKSCAIIVGSPVLARYIADTLPAMEVPAVPILTFQRWVRGLGVQLLGEAQPRLVKTNADGGRELVTPATPLSLACSRVLQSLAWFEHLEQCPLSPNGNVLSDLDAALAAREALQSRDRSKLVTKEVLDLTIATYRRDLQNNTLAPEFLLSLLRLAQRRGFVPLLPNGRRERYGHLVVDEVQDYGPLELAVVLQAAQSPLHITLVGDTNQQVGAQQSFPGWERLRSSGYFGTEAATFVSLTVSHRSTIQIMRLAESVLGAGKGHHTATGGRPGRIPIWFRANDESLGIGAALDWMNRAIERYPTALTAVVCATEAEAKHVITLLRPRFGSTARLGGMDSFSFESGIVVTDVRSVKGLEFTNVLIWNPLARSYPNDPVSRNRLYVAITRAQENLCICTWPAPGAGKTTELLPAFFSPLVRGIPVQKEPEEQEEADDRQSSNAER